MSVTGSTKPSAGSGSSGGAGAWIAALMSPAAMAKIAKSMSDAAAQSVAHLADMSERMLGGSYQPKDLMSDLTQCNERIVGLVQTVVGHMTGGASDPVGGAFLWAPPDEHQPDPPGADGTFDTGVSSAPTEWGTTMWLTVPGRPLTLQTAGFRRIGGGPAIVIGPAFVKFEPATIPDGTVTAFTVTVTMQGFGPGIYTGVITSVEHPGVAVTDPVMPTW